MLGGGGTEVSTSGPVETSVVAHEVIVAEFIRGSQLPDNEANSPARLGDSQPQTGNTVLPSPPATPLHPSSTESSNSYGHSLPMRVRAPSVTFSDNTDGDCPQPLPALLSDGESDGWNDEEVENVRAVPGVDGENAGVSSSQPDGQASSLSMLPASLKHSPALAAAFSASLLDRINALRLLVLDTDGAPVVPINHLRMRMRLGHLVVAPSSSASRSRSAHMHSSNPAADTAALVLTALNTETEDNDGTIRGIQPLLICFNLITYTDSDAASAQGAGLSDTSDQESDFSAYDEWSISESRVSHSHLCPLNWPNSSPQHASELGAFSDRRNFLPSCSSHATPITLGPSLLSASSSSSISTNIASSFSNCPCVLCKNPTFPFESLESELNQEDLDHCAEIASSEDILTNPDLDLCLQNYQDEKPSDTKFFFKVNHPTSSSIDTQDDLEPPASSALLSSQNLIYSKRRRLTAWQDRFADFTATTNEYKLKAFLQIGKKFSDRSSKWIQRRGTEGTAPLPPASTSGDADNYLVDLVEFHQQNNFWERRSRSVTDVRLSENPEKIDAATVACEGCVLLEQTRHRLRERVRRQEALDDDDTDDDDDDDDDDDSDDDDSDDDSESNDEDDWRAPRFGVVSRHARSHMGPHGGDDADAEFLDDENGLFDQEYAEGGNGEEEEDSDETDDDESGTEEDSEEDDDDDETEETDDDSDEESDSTFEYNDDECEEAFLDDYTHKVQELIGLQEVVWQLDHIAWAGR
ncbi:hypothetical protein CcCBS67573_g00545 [Chytriomyces confervae]|uniref:Uncharacterized protein n=1 Tax=Chytriomyces confervae TaxID=246404 RepID=A0A507FTP2_9FUNG|nr:hypothetical protein HDU80_001115 [Chytriomyces hyalinus]TPX78167.1 hypothetical protein CcCBS67573_g00545 [Chytriomyces confervae]